MGRPPGKACEGCFPDHGQVVPRPGYRTERERAAQGAGGAVQGAGILRGEAWFQDLSMRQGTGITSWLMLILLASPLIIIDALVYYYPNLHVD